MGVRTVIFIDNGQSFCLLYYQSTVDITSTRRCARHNYEMKVASKLPLTP